MEIFSQLLNLHSSPKPTENFFTEIVAHMLRKTEGLLSEWLVSLGLAGSDEVIKFTITTQTDYDEGRPDILVELFGEDFEDLIFVESKLGAREGFNQLQRYARELGKMSDARNRTLLYITRDYDPKDETEILQDLPAGAVRFRQLHWTDFYHFIALRREDDRLIDEICAFMEEQGMAHSNLFTQEDILVISKLPHIFSLMNETLFGEVEQRFRAVVGSVSTVKTTMDELRFGRYVLIGSLYNGGDCLLGYWFDESPYPEIGANIRMRPNSPDQATILAMLREISSDPEWKAYNLNQPRKWASVGVGRPLEELTVGEDHVRAIKDYFLELLDAVAEIKKRYPHISWHV